MFIPRSSKDFNDLSKSKVDDPIPSIKFGSAINLFVVSLILSKTKN